MPLHDAAGREVPLQNGVKFVWDRNTESVSFYTADCSEKLYLGITPSEKNDRLMFGSIRTDQDFFQLGKMIGLLHDCVVTVPSDCIGGRSLVFVPRTRAAAK